MNEQSKWTNEWPTVPGSYWFFGWRFGDRDTDPELSYVEVADGGVSAQTQTKVLAFITRGHFLYRTSAVGFWQLCDMPELPQHLHKYNDLT